MLPKVVGWQAEAGAHSAHQAVSQLSYSINVIQHRLLQVWHVMGKEVGAMHGCAVCHKRVVLTQLAAKVQPLLHVRSSVGQLLSTRKETAPSAPAMAHPYCPFRLHWPAEEGFCLRLKLRLQLLTDAMTCRA